jgi:hypothetical protein
MPVVNEPSNSNDRNTGQNLNSLNMLRSQERLARMQTRLPNLELGVPPIDEF